MNKNNNILQLPDYIENLDTSYCDDNLYFYKYHDRYLKKLQRLDIDKEDQHYISTYSSFVGEVFENIIYELLLRYALKDDEITQFILKGPHQNFSQNLKSGFMCDFNSQIVYKSGYKDITEFDALFFTSDSVYFVESTIVKTTTNLRKRLKKKRSLLEVLFPNLKVKALIILSQGALGIKVFPKYCTVWVTKPLVDDELISKIITNKNDNKEFTKFKHKKLIQAKNIKTAEFRYFDTLGWIYKKSSFQRKLNFDFLMSKKLSLYFDIFTKLYIGYLDTKTFVEVLKHFDITNLSEDIKLNNIEDSKIILTIEKTDSTFVLVYYLKIQNESLKKLELKKEQLTLDISNKDPKGFTVAEIKYIRYLLNEKNKFNLEDIIQIEETKPMFKK